MKIEYPYQIENRVGEKLIFKEVVNEPDGDKVIVENFVQPGCGPIMHTHLRQDEALTVVKGKMGYQILGQEPKFAGEGETVVFERGVPHRFWNEGEEVLNCLGWVKPAENIVYYLAAIYAAQNKTGSHQPETFDAAYLITRYASEYDLPDLPAFVKKGIMPLIVFIGKLLGKYKHFEDAPKPFY